MNRLNRRSLLKAASHIPLLGVTLPYAQRAAAQTQETLPWYNWSGALSCQPQARMVPATEAELSELLAATEGAVRPVGSGHSFSPLVPTDGHLVVIDQLTGLHHFDPQTNLATFGAGTRLSDIGPALKKHGRALQNMPDIDRQTIAGAISTATHGTGLTLSCLSDEVAGLRLVTPAGEVKSLSASSNADLFNAARVSLGALGVITQVSFDTREHYRLQAKNEVRPMNEALEGFVEAAKSHRHYELFPLVHSDYSITLAIDETEAPVNTPPTDPEEEDSFAGMLAYLSSLPVSERKAVTNEMAGQIPATEMVDDAHSMLTNVRNLRFNEMEYSVELDVGMDCVREVLAAIQSNAVDVAFPLEVRCVRGDDTWLSMSAGEASHVAISIHRQAGADYRPYFDLIEPIFWKYGGRPHWGKVHSLDAQALGKLYPRFADFQALRAEIDPHHRMLNTHLKKLLIG